jgi:NADH-quinone oxidoreductase subunit E
MALLTEDRLKKVEEIVARYPEGRQKSALIPVLHLAQEQYGWLSAETMDHVAGLLKIEPIEVYEVATFYSMFHLEKPGKYVFEVCQTGPCMLRGSDRIIEYIGQKLGIKPGETSADGLVTLKPVECLGACGYAPMMQLGKHYREHLTEQRIDEIIEECRKNA